ncbi:MAG: CPBP family intramembrane metalloprotease [Armatimonadetes bacterium]|nr:CPBP family intramembrane metalloprotease [Armatimonadota bacterium]
MDSLDHDARLSPSEEPEPLPALLPAEPDDEGADSSLHPFWRVFLYLLAITIGGFLGLMLFLIPYMIVEAIRAGKEFESAYGNMKVMPADLTIVAMTSAYLAITTITFLFARHLDRRSLRNLGFRREGWAKGLGTGALLGVGYIAVTVSIYLALGWMRFDPVPVKWGLWVVASLLLWPLVGITEEVVFRGYLLKNFEEWKGPTFAILTTTILFWLIHLGQGNVHEPLGAAVMLSMGAIFAFLRYGTGSLWAPIGLHAAYDWAAISFGGFEPDVELPALYHADVRAPHWLVGPPGHSGLADLLFLLLMLGLAYGFYRRSR